MKFCSALLCDIIEAFYTNINIFIRMSAFIRSTVPYCSSSLAQKKKSIKPCISSSIYTGINNNFRFGLILEKRSTAILTNEFYAKY